MMTTVRHVWFDVEGTLTVRTPAYRRAHDELLLETFAEVTGRPESDELSEELKHLKLRYGSNSAVFHAYGQPPDFWAKRFDRLDQARFYAPSRQVTETVQAIGRAWPMSLFTNVTRSNLDKTLRLIALDPAWFIHILTGDDVPERKPAIDGFVAMIEKSAVPAADILYVCDRVDVDVRPAKKVGLRTCLVWGQTEEADYSCSDFAGLRDVLFGDRA
jgi:FMN phosphatase YigB (HAD superfamily)